MIKILITNENKIIIVTDKQTVMRRKDYMKKNRYELIKPKKYKKNGTPNKKLNYYYQHKLGMKKKKRKWKQPLFFQYTTSYY